MRAPRARGNLRLALILFRRCHHHPPPEQLDGSVLLLPVGERSRHEDDRAERAPASSSPRFFCTLPHYPSATAGEPRAGRPSFGLDACPIRACSRQENLGRARRWIPSFSTRTRWPSMPARSLTQSPARGRCRSTRRPPMSFRTRTMRPACSTWSGPGTSTAGSPTRPWPCSRSGWRPWRAGSPPSPPPAGRRRCIWRSPR